MYGEWRFWLTGLRQCFYYTQRHLPQSTNLYLKTVKKEVIIYQKGKKTIINCRDGKAITLKNTMNRFFLTYLCYSNIILITHGTRTFK